MSSTTIHFDPVDGFDPINDETVVELTPTAPKVYYLVKEGNSLRPVLVKMDASTELEYNQRFQDFEKAFREALPDASSPDIAFAEGYIMYRRNGQPKPVSITLADAAARSPQL